LKIKKGTSLCFDDVLLSPKYSDIRSRNEVDLSTNLTNIQKLQLPIVSSPMDTVTGAEMMLALHVQGGLGILHRYNSIDQQTQEVKTAQDMARNRGYDNMIPAVAIGVSGDYHDRAVSLYEAGTRVFCVDVAHGHHVLTKLALGKLRSTFGSDVHIIAGNVATLEAFNDLSDWGADSVRVGVGGGSICSTRIQTGHGIPTLQSVLDCAQSDRDAQIIADGGIKNSGDAVKALAAGADLVMFGSMLAGTDESPGEIMTTNNMTKIKTYRGMASRAAQLDWRGKYSSDEGISTTIPYKGPVSVVLNSLEKGIRSGLSYSGARSINELQANAIFVRQTTNGLAESKTHILDRKV
jgi:IMP dehydrogenase